MIIGDHFLKSRALWRLFLLDLDYRFADFLSRGKKRVFIEYVIDNVRT